MSGARPVALTSPTRGPGPQWGMQSDDLNATLLDWAPGDGVAAHANNELDVLIVVLEGSACIDLSGVAHELRSCELLLMPRGSTRAITAGTDGVRYLSIHRRRGPLLPAPAPGDST